MMTKANEQKKEEREQRSSFLSAPIQCKEDYCCCCYPLPSYLICSTYFPTPTRCCRAEDFNPNNDGCCIAAGFTGLACLICGTCICSCAAGENIVTSNHMAFTKAASIALMVGSLCASASLTYFGAGPYITSSLLEKAWDESMVEAARVGISVLAGTATSAVVGGLCLWASYKRQLRVGQKYYIDFNETNDDLEAPLRQSPKAILRP